MKPAVVIFERDGATVGQSGLTGSPDIPEPDQQGPSGVSGHLRSFRESAAGTAAAFPRVLRLVWEASPFLTVSLGVAVVAAGVVPAATAYTARLLMNAVVNAIVVRAQHVPDRVVLTAPIPGLNLELPVLTTMQAIVVLAILQFVIYALSSLFNAVRNVSQQALQNQVTTSVQLMVMEHAVQLDLRFFEGSSSYDLLRQAGREAAIRPVTMIGGAFSLVQTAVTFATMTALLAGLNPLLALAAFITPIPAFISDTRYGAKTFALARWASPICRRMEYLTSLVTTDTYVKEVQLFGLGSHFVERFRMLARVYNDRQRKLIRDRYLAGYAWSLITTVTGSLTYLYVAVQAVAGRLTPGDLLLYASAATSVQASIQGLLQGVAGMYEHNLYLNKLYELLAIPATVSRPERPVPLPRPLRGNLAFEHVSFTYPGSTGEALQDVSFEMRAGETIAIVGRNGAGKSTLVKLLCRLYDPTDGRIVVDGTDIREVDPGELRSNIAGMFQDYVTYQATAAENIGLGDVNHIEDISRIQQAASRAGAKELVERLPNGYDTALGRWFSRGVNLSGGQWQKMALARAFVRDVPFLVLDEPTAALDAEAEHELFKRLRLLAGGRTTIYISHRFSTVIHADRILYLDRGRLVEEGTHEELMRVGGGYARLFRMQLSSYSKNDGTEY